MTRFLALLIAAALALSACVGPEPTKAGEQVETPWRCKDVLQRGGTC